MGSLDRDGRKRAPRVWPIAAALIVLAMATPAAASKSEVRPTPPSGLVLGGGRVVVGESSVAITLPPDWTALIPSEGDLEAIADELDRQTPGSGADVRRIEPGSVSLIAFAPIGSSAFAESCTLVTDDDHGLSLDLFTASALAVVQGDPSLVGDPTHTPVRIAARDAVRIDAVRHMPAAGGDPVTVDSAAYLVVDPPQVLGLTCMGGTAPADRWMSIAATLELLHDPLQLPGTFDGPRDGRREFTAVRTS